MRDLLNEDDFLQKPYNPWPRFSVYYAIEVVAIVINILLMLLSDSKYNAMFALGTIVLLPVILAPMMILHKKKYTVITDSQAIRGMLILFLIYLAPVLLAMLGDAFTTGIDSGGIIITVILLIVYGICFLCVIAISREERRRHINSSETKMKNLQE